jgi:hypothetical protein
LTEICRRCGDAVEVIYEDHGIEEYLHGR